MSISLTRLILNFLHKLLSFSHSNPDDDLQDIDRMLRSELPESPESREFIRRILNELIEGVGAGKVSAGFRVAIRRTLSEEEILIVSQCQTARRFCELLRLINFKVEPMHWASSHDESPEPLPLERPVLHRGIPLLTALTRAYFAASVLLLIIVLYWIWSGSPR